MLQPKKGKLSKLSFNDWYKTVPETKNDTSNYDLKAAYDNLPYEDMYNFATSEVHLPDTYKKANHPTFSNESIYHNDSTPGGKWSVNGKGQDVFSPSQHNIDNFGGPEKYNDWFQKNEPDVILDLPESIIKAKRGLYMGFVPGGQWNIVDDLKGPSHKQGGIDLYFGKDGTYVNNSNGSRIKAEKGLVLRSDGGKEKESIASPEPSNVNLYDVDKWGRRIAAKNYEYDTDEDRLHYYKTYSGYARNATKGSNVPMEALLQQGYLETLGGRRMPKNNLFGITAQKPGEGVGKYETFEYFDTNNRYEVDSIDNKAYLKSDYPLKDKQQIYSIDEVTEGKNKGRYKYKMDRYFREYNNIDEGMTGYVENLSTHPAYKEAVSDEKIYSDPFKFMENISGAYSTSNAYGETNKKSLGFFVDINKKIKKSALNKSKEDFIKSKIPSFKNGGLPSGIVEAEGQELVIRNSSGDMAIIPKNKRNNVIKMINSNNDKKIDNIVSELPKIEDYNK